MKKFAATVSLALFALAALILAAPGVSDAAPVLKISHPRPIQSETNEDLEAFAKNVEKYSDGRVKCQVYAANQLGGVEQVMEYVGMGTVEMLLGWPNATLEPKLEVNNLPGLISNYDESRKVYKQGSSIFNLLNELYNNYNQVLIAVYPSGSQFMSFRNDPGDIVYDPIKPKGIKLRQAAQRYLIYITDGLGYITSPLPWGEVFTALQTGIIDGLGSYSAESTYLMLRDAINYVLPVITYVDVWLFTINKDLWEGFPEEDRAAIAKAAAEFQERRYDRIADSEKEYLDKLREHGVKIMDITDEQQAAFQKRIREYVWEHLRKDLGDEFIDKTLKAFDESIK